MSPGPSSRWGLEPEISWLFCAGGLGTGQRPIGHVPNRRQAPDPHQHFSGSEPGPSSG